MFYIKASLLPTVEIIPLDFFLNKRLSTYGYKLGISFNIVISKDWDKTFRVKLLDDVYANLLVY